MTLRLGVGSVTDVGRARDHNEDAFFVDTTAGLLAVADGMGGHQGGEVASATALEALRAAIAEGASVPDAVRRANQAVHDQAAADDQLRGMGTTLTAATFGDDATLEIAHVGDSRAYLMRDGVLARITTDHSLVQELVDAGELTEEEARSDPRRSMITRALGMDAEVEVDAYPVGLRRGDRVLLCSDGLTSMVDDDGIAVLLASEADPTEAARALVTAANDAGGLDNVTVIVIDVIDDDETTSAVDPVVDDDPTVAVAPVAPVAPVGPPEARAAASSPTPPRTRGRLARTARRLVPLVAVLALLVGGSFWYARRGYFVGEYEGRVAIFDGRPGGFLFFDPALEADFVGLPVNELPPRVRASVREGETFSSIEAANDRKDELAALIEQRSGDTGSSSGTSTTTTTTTNGTGAGAGGSPA